MSRAKEKVETFVSYLGSKHLGLKRKTVSLLPHKKEWKEAFLWVSSQIEKELPRVQIYHVGSTSVEGLAAKPILDVLVLFEKEADQLEGISKLENLGFVHKGDGVALVTGEEEDPGRHFYSYYDLKEKVDYVHLHTYVIGHSDVEKLLNFRDSLRASEEARNNYEALKKEIYQSGKTRKDYTNAKKHFVEKLLIGL